MNVMVETTALYTSRAGVARYVEGLLRGLRAVSEPDVVISELGWSVENLGYAQPQRALKTLIREWGWAKLIAPGLARSAAVLHHTSLPIIPLDGRPRHVVALHDLAVLRHPGRFRPWQRAAALRRLRRLKHADRIVCDSRFTADEAMQLLGLPAAKLEVVHLGGWLSPATDDLPKPPSVLPADYFLFVGSLEPGKNLALLRAIYLAADRPPPPLVVVGARWEGVPREGPPPPGWHFLGHTPDDQLAALYRGARALLFPSVYEGFGLPVLEAMQHGCPVLCGPVASLPEVAGGAAALAELAPGPFAAAMHRLSADDGWRAHLQAAGRARAAEFSWEKCARETLAVYRSVAGSS